MTGQGILRRWAARLFDPEGGVRGRYDAFRRLLRQDGICLSFLADLEEMATGAVPADPSRAPWLLRRMGKALGRMVDDLDVLSPGRYPGLPRTLERLLDEVRRELSPPEQEPAPPWLLPLDRAADRPDLAGGKAANLARAARVPGLRVPPGFVVSTSACRRFLAENGLIPEASRRLRRMDLSRPEELERLCGEMRALVLAAPVPEDLAGSMVRAAAELCPDGGRLAVRSSGLAEDGRFTFAGQYVSELGVSPAEVPAAWRRVLAGRYAPRAVTYRILCGLADEETPMAALVLPMVDARCAGVVYTRNPPGEACRECLAVFSAPGLGRDLVSGRVTPQVHRFSRDPVPVLLAPPDQPDPLLSPEAALSLAVTGLALEGHFGPPQDVEWALDRQGRITVLQARPLADDEPPFTESPPEDGTPALAENLGRASAGLAWGPVFQAAAGEDPALAPEGAVLVVRDLSPDLVRLVGRVAAVVSVEGSRAGHFASVAREMGLPVVVAGAAALRLPAGREVTVDGFRGSVLAGRAAGAVRSRPAARPPRRLRAALPRISRLTLTDPQSPDFTPERAESLHDMIRFCHEKSVQAMFGLVEKGGRGLGRARRLASSLPLTMYVLDLGGGLSGPGEGDVSPEAFASRPLRAIWEGLSDPAASRGRGGVQLDWEEFDRISAGIFDPRSRLLASYALASADWVHLLLRFGYHFSEVGALAGSEARTNYAVLRFKGGGAGTEGRRLRRIFLTRALQGAGFVVRVRGDLLEARLDRRGREETLAALALLGRLTAAVRFLDAELPDEAAAEDLARTFGPKGSETEEG